MSTFRFVAAEHMLYVDDRPYPAQRGAWDDGPPGMAEAQAAGRFMPSFRHYTRQVIVPFENRWGLSTIWGDMNYCSNYEGYEQREPFLEEPHTVEVGVLMPAKGLYVNPFGWVDADAYQRLADCVMHLPTGWDLVWDGDDPYLDEFIDFINETRLDREGGS